MTTKEQETLMTSQQFEEAMVQNKREHQEINAKLDKLLTAIYVGNGKPSFNERIIKLEDVSVKPCSEESRLIRLEGIAKVGVWLAVAIAVPVIAQGVHAVYRLFAK